MGAGSNRQAATAPAAGPASASIGAWARRRRARGAPARAALELGASLLLIGALAWPLLFTSATFNQDWLNHLWFLWHQSLAIRSEHAPSLFLSYSRGILYPLYAFYGGTLYALAGTLSLALGDAPLQTYVCTYLLGFAAAYGGWYWMARMFGQRGWLAHLPGLVFVTSASYLMIVYALGDWAEFIATSTMPLLIAAGLSVLRAERMRFWPSLALAASGCVFFGSHLLTVIWGSTILLIAAAAMAVCVPEARHGVSRAGLLRLAALVVPALLVSAWFLLPTIAYESQTTIAASYRHFRWLLRETSPIVASTNLFSLSRSPAPGALAYTALPVLAIAWSVLSVAGSLRAGHRGCWLRVFLVLAGSSTLVGIVMTHVGVILGLPRLYATLQFSFRLESYLLLGISGALLAALVLARDAGPNGRRWTWMLAPVAVASIAGALVQVGRYHPGIDRRLALSSYLRPTYEQEALLNYVDENLLVWHGARLPRLQFPLRSLHGGRVAVTVHEPQGQLMATNLRSLPALVAIHGAQIVGVDREADDVIEIARGGSGRGAQPAQGGALDSERGGVEVASGPKRTETVTLAPASPLPVTLGRALSLVGLLALLLQLIFIAARSALAGRSRETGFADCD